MSDQLFIEDNSGIEAEIVETPIVNPDVVSFAEINARRNDPNVTVGMPDRVAQSMGAAIRTFEAELEHFDGVTTKTFNVRDEMIDKIAHVVRSIETIDLGSPDDVNSKLSIINVAGKLLADQEASAVRRVATKRAYENQRTSDAMAAANIETLKRMREDKSILAAVGSNVESSASLIDADLEEAGDVVLDTELREDWEDVDPR